MKLSWKFFIIAYLITLLSTSIGSAFLIQNSINLLWESQMNRVITSENYAVQSFLSLANISTGKIIGKQNATITRQIEAILDSCITELTITPTDEVTNQNYLELENNMGFNHFTKENNSLFMESVCLVPVGDYQYIIHVKSDFSELQNYQKQIWRGYNIAVISIAIISGSLLYFFASKITKPLNTLTTAANDIALGSYGKTVNIKSNNIEISDLAHSFNSMSIATKEALDEIKREADKKQQFVANFTHEMKTPMTAIIGYADLLQSYDLSLNEKQQAASSIYKESKRLEHLSRQLLEIFVIQNETPKLISIQLSDIQQSLQETLNILSKKYHIDFEISFPNIYVLANPTLLVSLLYNLADNAFKASNIGQKIYIYARINDMTVTIYVQDTGRGIDSSHIALLTEPFYREDKARSRKLGGAGLGLSICKEITKIHNTQLTILSEIQKGTTVSFQLKLAGELHEKK